MTVNGKSCIQTADCEALPFTKVENGKCTCDLSISEPDYANNKCKCKDGYFLDLEEK